MIVEKSIQIICQIEFSYLIDITFNEVQKLDRVNCFAQFIKLFVIYNIYISNDFCKSILKMLTYIFRNNNYSLECLYK